MTKHSVRYVSFSTHDDYLHLIFKPQMQDDIHSSITRFM